VNYILVQRDFFHSLILYHLSSILASRTTLGNVNLHWKCAMAPVDVLPNIVVHELAHLIHPNHTPAFWDTVDKILSNYYNQ
jgi:predicted metal-dependent hydrolase